MKRTLSMIAFATLTVGLLGSCSKINERLDNLDKRIDGLENEQIASINSQISGITSSISDLGQIRSDISSLKQSASDHSVDIFNLEEADRALKDRILNLEDYVDAVLPNYAEKEWVEATFSTLEQYEATCDTIAKIDARIGALDAKLSKDIKATADSLTKWVNKTFEGYYTAAEMDAKLAQMKSAVDSAKAAGKISDAKADSIATELTNAKAEVDTAKANIRAEYRAAIGTAIKASEGKLTKELTDAIATVNGKIESLTTRVGNLETSVADLKGRVDKLEEMIQSVVIVPAYSDGSVEAINGIVELNLIVSPSSAVEGLTNEKVNILLNTVATKAVSVDTVEADKIKSFTVDKTKGTVEIKADISENLPTEDGQALTVAVSVANGDLSDFTTEFVGVKTVVKTLTFKAVYDTKNEANTLTFYYDYIDHSGEGIAVYDNLPTAANNDAAWGYNDVRAKIKKVVITESVKEYSSLTSTAFMFHGMTIASSIEGAEYLDVTNVTNMAAMFWNFGSDKSSTLELAPEVDNWNTGEVENMQNMFMNYGAGPKDFNDVPNVINWDTRNVTNMSNMFKGFASTSEELECAPKVNGTNWNTVEVNKNLNGMFSYYGTASNKLKEAPDVSNWKTEYVTNMGDLFNYYGSSSGELKDAPKVDNWDTGNVTNVTNLFQKYGNGSASFNLDLSKWDLSKITSASNVFECTPAAFNVTIPAKTGEKSNEGGKWYYGDGTNSIAPPAGKTFTPAAPTISTIADVLATAGDNAPSAANHWNDTKGNYIYVDGGYLLVVSLAGTLDVALDNTVTPNGDNYLYSEGVLSFTFNMTEGVLTSIYVNCSVYGVNDTFSPAPNSALKGVFSVSATKKVQFSRGNLYWDGDSYEFEENQYTIGTWNAENHVNYFFWSKEKSVAKAESYSDASAADTDVFFTNATAVTAKADFTVSGVTGKFRTLSAEEWTYILSTRANAVNLLVEDVTVCGVEHCLVIAPDACLNSYEFDKAKKSYDAAAWATAEAAGLVCLPPAGYRDGTDVKSGDGNGFYWASTTDAADKASNLGFKKSDN